MSEKGISGVVVGRDKGQLWGVEALPPLGPDAGEFPQHRTPKLAFVLVKGGGAPD